VKNLIDFSRFSDYGFMRHWTFWNRW
jgi:hypothetical protein